MNSTDTRAQKASSSVNPYKGMFDVIATPLVDAQSASTWYLGNFKAQFIYRELIKLEVSSNRSEDVKFLRDVVVRYKARFQGSTEALDYRNVVKSTAA